MNLDNNSISSYDDVAIPVDPDLGDTDSSFGADDFSSTSSLTDRITQYRVLHGRTFHNFNDSDYWAPNDETMSDYLDISHHMFNLLLDGKLFLAPIGPNPQKVLDVGTGTGIWAMYGLSSNAGRCPVPMSTDFADEFPSAEVIGTDISPTQPIFVPPNCKFELDDAQLEWTYAPDSFDFIHVRALYGGISDWAALYDQIFKCTKPGGWLEQIEISIILKSDDGSVTEDHFMAKWGETFLKAAEMTGKSLASYEFMKDHIAAAGFVDIHEKTFKVPVGDWPSDPKMKELGRWSRLFCLQGLESWALYLLSQVLKWDYVEIQVYIATMRREVLSRSNHSWFQIKLVYGRKPEKEKEHYQEEEPELLQVV